MRLAALAGILSLAGCGASAASPSSPSTAATVKAAARPAPSEWPSPYGTDWVVFHGDCDVTMKAWTTFLGTYDGTASLPEKNLAAATAASTIADAAYDLVSKLPATQPAVLTLNQRSETSTETSSPWKPICRTVTRARPTRRLRAD
jgi:hypothetical protein